jgi:hypothetical protein
MSWIPPYPGVICPKGANQRFPVKSRLQKYSDFQKTQISDISLSVPAHPKGAFAIVTDAGRGMRWTRMVL